MDVRLDAELLQLGLPQVVDDRRGCAVAVVSEALVNSLVFVFGLVYDNGANVGQLYHSVAMTTRVKVNSVPFPGIPVNTSC